MRRKDGFTIVELMAATAISVLFSVAFFAAFYAMRNELYQQTSFFNSNRSVRFAVDIIARDAKEAISIEPTRGADTTGNQVLILRLASIDANGEPTNFDTDFDYVVYKLDSADPAILRRSLDVLNGTSTRNAGADITDKEVARSVQTLLFSSGGVGLSSLTAQTISGLRQMNIQIQARGTTLLSTQTQTAEGDSELLLRNKV